MDPFWESGHGTHREFHSLLQSHTEEWKESLPGPRSSPNQEDSPENFGKQWVNGLICSLSVKPFYHPRTAGVWRLDFLEFSFIQNTYSYCIKLWICFLFCFKKSHGTLGRLVNRWQREGGNKQTYFQNITYGLFPNSWLREALCFTFIYLKFSFQMLTRALTYLALPYC